MSFDYKKRLEPDALEKVMEASFVRIIITVTSVLAVISLLFRYWLYTFWMDFQNSKELQMKYMEI